MKRLIVKCNFTNDGQPQELIDKADAVRDEMEVILNSSMFRSRIIFKLTNSLYKQAEFSMYKNATPEEIYLRILRAEQEANPENYRVIELDINRKLILNKRSRKVLNIHSKFFEKNGSKECGAHILFLECMRLGFRSVHYKNNICHIAADTYRDCFDVLFGSSDPRDKVLIKKGFFRKRKWYRYTTKNYQLSFFIS